MTTAPDWEEFRKEWLESERALRRVENDIKTMTERFCDDFGEQYAFRISDPVTSRRKSPERAFAKIPRYTDEGRIEEATHCFGISDAVGVRIVCRGLAQLEGVKRALADGNYPLPLKVDESRIYSPSKSGYRALHANGKSTTKIATKEWHVPFEIQVKTMAQNAWGTYTHADAYSRLDLRNDPRFSLIHRLNRLLSAQLHVVDELSQEIDWVTNDLTATIAREPIRNDAELTFREVLSVVYDELEEVLHYSEAEEIAELALRQDVRTGTDFKSRVMPMLQDVSERMSPTGISAPPLFQVIKATLQEHWPK